MPLLRSFIDPTKSNHRRIEIVAHRGASGDAPENTMASFELALQQGAEGIEFDVHLSRDRVPVVIHDARLDRTTSGTGRVAEYSALALAKLDAGSWFNRRFPSRARANYSACKVPPLDEVLDWVRTRRTRAYLEIKQTRPRYRGIEAVILEHVYRAGVQDRVTIISFHLPTLRRLRRLDSRIALGIDFMRPLFAITLAKALSADTLLPHWRSAAPRWVARTHHAGLKVVVWGLDDPRGMRRQVQNGVDGIITSFPAVLRQILEASRR